MRVKCLNCFLMIFVLVIVLFDYINVKICDF